MKIPTPKQVRYHYKKIHRLHNQLGEALNQAHNAGVIVYEQAKYTDEGPCYTHYKTWQRFRDTTKDQLANAMATEIVRDKK